MYSSRFTYSFYLLSFALLVQTILGVDPLLHTCTSDNFTANSPYEANVNKLMGYLYDNTSLTGFGLGSLGETPNQAYGLALCRGDVSTTDCETCVVEANNEIRKSCPYGKKAIIWYDNCLLKYSNENFFGKIDDTINFYRWKSENMSDPVAFNQKTKELLSQLAKEASVSPKMYAAGALELEESKKIYGLAQCTRDLSSIDCKFCLDGFISEIPNGTQGGRALSGSCYVIFEIYNFVNA